MRCRMLGILFMPIDCYRTRSAPVSPTSPIGITDRSLIQTDAMTCDAQYTRPIWFSLDGTYMEGQQTTSRDINFLCWYAVQ